MKNQKVESLGLSEMLDRLSSLPETAIVQVVGMMSQDDGLTMSIVLRADDAAVIFPALERENAFRIAKEIEAFAAEHYNKPAIPEFPDYMDAFPNVAGKSNGARCGCIGFRCTCKLVH